MWLYARILGDILARMNMTNKLPRRLQVASCTLMTLALVACGGPMNNDAGGADGDGGSRTDIATDRPNTMGDDRPNPTDMPTVDVPNVDVPNAPDVPDFDVPDPVDVPDFDVPNRDVPNGRDVPNVDVPNVDVPNRDVPNVDVPNRDVPNDTGVLPDSGVPSVCAMPRAGLTVPMSNVMVTTMATGTTNANTCSNGRPNAGEAAFSLNVPAMTGLILSTDMLTMGDPVVTLRRNCLDGSAASEVLCDDDSGPSTNSFARGIVPAGMYTVLVDSFSASSFRLNVQTFAPAANAECAGATTLLNAVATTNSTANAGTNRVPMGCGPTDTGGQVYYTYTIPANTQTTFTSVRNGMQDFILRQFDSCGLAACGGFAQTTAMTGTVAPVISNTSNMPRTVVFSVASTSSDPAANANFTITPMNRALAANALCANAITVNAGGSAAGNTAGAAVTATTCRIADGPQLFYSVTIPPGRRGILSLTRAGAQDTSMRVLDSCAANSCVSSTVTAGVAPVSLNVDNQGAANRTVIVSVSSASALTPAAFTLGFATTPLPYALTRMAGQMCDTVPAMTPILANTTGDDVNSAPAAMPFALRFYGANYTHMSVSSNGFMQLGVAAPPINPFGGGPSAAHVAIPTPGAPEPFIAPFWSDLRDVVGGGSGVQVFTVGAAPNRRYVLHWNNVTHFNSTTIRLSFQVRLYETTNVIETVYCTVTPGMDNANRATGSQATIGIENANGTDGVEAAFDNAMAIAAGTMYRFTPAP